MWGCCSFLRIISLDKGLQSGQKFVPGIRINSGLQEK